METKKPICYARFLHACSDVSRLDLFVNDKKLAKNFCYKDLTEYFSASPGIYHLVICPEGNREAALFDDHVEMFEDSVYTIAAAGTAKYPNLDIICDKKRHLNPGRAHIRFVNLSHSCTSVHIFLNENMSIPDLSYHEVSDYTPIPSGALNIKAKDVRTGQTVLPDHRITLQSGATHVGYIIENTGGSQEVQILISPEGASHLQF